MFPLADCDLAGLFGLAVAHALATLALGLIANHLHLDNRHVSKLPCHHLLNLNQIFSPCRTLTPVLLGNQTCYIGRIFNCIMLLMSADESRCSDALNGTHACSIHEHAV